MRRARNGRIPGREGNASGERARERAIPLLALALSLSLSGCVDDTVSQLVFTPPSGRPAFSYAAAAVSGTASCLVTEGGKARCWGLGPLGDGRRSESATPIGVTGGISFLQVDVSSAVRCGLSTNQVILCWGNNLRGQLGTGTTESSDIPVEAETDLRFTQVSANVESVCGIDLDRDAWCWGRNNHGQLGIASPDSMRVLPSPVAAASSTNRLPWDTSRCAASPRMARRIAGGGSGGMSPGRSPCRFSWSR
jgi:hypothetical protein